MKAKGESVSKEVKKHVGDLIAKPGVVYDFEEITGTLDASGADTRTAFPKLTTVGGTLYAHGADTRTAFPRLTTVGGGLYAHGADTRTAFPRLTTVGGYLYAHGADTRTAFPKLTTVGGFLDASGADTKTAFPRLTTVGGTLDASGADTSKVKANDPGARAKCATALKAALAIHGLVLQDGILSKIVSKRGGLYRVRVIGQTHISYVIERDGVTAHGKTLQLARADLLFKLGKRDTSAFRQWDLHEARPLEEVVAAYRAITGACGHGVELFMNGKGFPAKVSVSFAIKETKGQYGHDTFASFFKATA